MSASYNNRLSPFPLWCMHDFNGNRIYIWFFVPFFICQSILPLSWLSFDHVGNRYQVTGSMMSRTEEPWMVRLQVWSNCRTLYEEQATLPDLYSTASCRRAASTTSKALHPIWRWRRRSVWGTPVSLPWFRKTLIAGNSMWIQKALISRKTADSVFGTAFTIMISAPETAEIIMPAMDMCGTIIGCPVHRQRCTWDSLYMMRRIGSGWGLGEMFWMVNAFPDYAFEKRLLSTCQYRFLTWQLVCQQGNNYKSRSWRNGSFLNNVYF